MNWAFEELCCTCAVETEFFVPIVVLIAKFFLCVLLVFYDAGFSC